jgi:hypothetical protein
MPPLACVLPFGVRELVLVPACTRSHPINPELLLEGGVFTKEVVFRLVCVWVYKEYHVTSPKV